MNSVYCTFYHSPLCGVENILTGLYLWPAGLVLEWIMKRTKIISLVVHLYWEPVSCVGFCVCGLSKENRASVRVNVWAKRIKISSLMSNECAALSEIIICLCFLCWDHVPVQKNKLSCKVFSECPWITYNQQQVIQITVASSKSSCGSSGLR